MQYLHIGTYLVSIVQFVEDILRNGLDIKGNVKQKVLDKNTRCTLPQLARDLSSCLRVKKSWVRPGRIFMTTNLFQADILHLSCLLSYPSFGTISFAVTVPYLPLSEPPFIIIFENTKCVIRTPKKLG